MGSSALQKPMPALKQSALQIFRETLAAIDIPSSMRRKLARADSHLIVNGKRFDLAAFDRICAVAFGKASLAMTRGLAELFSPDFRSEGIVVAPAATSNLPEGIRLIVAGHPLPDEGSFAAGRAILDMLATAMERTLVFFLLSGGGSSLVEFPLDPGVTLEDLKTLNRVFDNLRSPDRRNQRRAQASFRGEGRTACRRRTGSDETHFRHYGCARRAGVRLGSGPTIPDPTTVFDACSVIVRYALLAKLPTTIREKFEHPCDQFRKHRKRAIPAFASAHPSSFC